MQNELICAYCKKTITNGKYLKDYWGNVYHIEHRGVVPRCIFCGRLTYNCTSCNKKRILRLSQINLEYKKVSDILAKCGFDIRKYKTEIFLLEPKKSIKTTKEEPGYIKVNKKMINGIVKEISFKIFIVKGLPTTYFLSTLAHELIHQWITLYGQKDITPVLNEGTSNYGSYLLLKELKTPLSYYIIESMMQDRHPYYGKGFRKVLSYTQKYGHKAFINYLKTHKRI